jgi:hypothetical protein
LIERASLVLKFVAQNNTVDLFPPNLNSPPVTESIAALASRAKFVQSSLESLQADQKNYPQRLQSQTMIVTNLVAQQEVALSLQVATDSKEIAAASRRDSAVMKIIAALGALFLPGTFIAVRPPKPLFVPNPVKPNPANLLQTLLALIPRTWGAGQTIWMYFAITIPFTVVVLGIVGVCWCCLDDNLGAEVETKNDATSGSNKGTERSDEV